MEVTVKLPDILAARAQSSGLAPDAYAEQLLQKIAETAEQQGHEREQLREELKADWAHFQSTGLHLDEQEVDSWLAGFEHGHDSVLPELHI